MDNLTIDVLKNHYVFDDIEKKVSTLRWELRQVNELIEVKPASFHMKRKAKIEEELTLFKKIIDYIKISNGNVEKAYQDVYLSDKISSESAEITRIIDLLRENTHDLNIQIMDITNINLRLLKEIKKVTEDGETPDTERIKKAYHNQSVMVKRISERLKEILK